MGRFQFELATEGEDAELRQVLNAIPMPGTLSITLRREPSFLKAARVEGPFRQIILCRDTEKHCIAGFGSRSIRERFINGAPTGVGYLSMLRGLNRYRKGSLLARGYHYLKELHADGRAKLYLTTIAEGNAQAVAILTKGRAGLPHYHSAGKYHTLAIPIVQNKRMQTRKGGVKIRPATEPDLERIMDFLHRYGSERQFFPNYQTADFFHPEGTFIHFQPSDLLLAFQGEELVGTLGGWDQNPFRQMVVEKYGAALRWIRPFYNVGAKLRGRPLLPPPGDAIPLLTAALPVVKNDDPAIFTSLLDALLAQPASKRFSYLLLGLHESDPLLPVVKGRETVSYITALYLACWTEGEDLRSGLDRRAPYLELGCL